MSHNLISGRYLTTEDDDFVLKVDKDIRSYYLNSPKNSVLLFPPVNSYYRFLIHKVCNSLANELSNSGLTTFSIGLGDRRRTIVCHTNQLLIYPTSSTHKSSEETEFNWLYVARNSVPKYTATTNDVKRDDKHREHRSNTEIMGIENVDAIVSHQTIEERDNSCYKTEKSSLSEDSIIAKKNSRTRRPERAFYVPRAKRSQTTPPNCTTSLKSHNKKKSEKSKSIDESASEQTSNSEESNDTDTLPPSSNQNQFFDCTVINSIDKKNHHLDSQSSSSNCCDLFNQNCSEVDLNSQDITKDQKNHNNYCTMSSLQQTEKELIIENGSKVDKDEKELIKASQEINRSNRKLIKQTFNSNVLEIETASGSTESKNDDKAVNKDEDDWDSLFDDNGDCLDQKMVEEITKAVGKVQIEKPKSDYKAYHANVELLKDQEYPHVLECSNFPVEFRTQDLMNLFGPFTRDSGFNIIWVDDTHCLVVFSSSKIAAEVLSANHPIVKVKPLAEATSESRTKARKCSSSLQPYRQRPETCAALAKRLVSGALGVRIKATSEERENERRVLREAKERKLLAAKAREEMWNN